MVKKLFKHEFIYYFRSFGLFLPIVLLIAVMKRVSGAIGGNETIQNLLFASSTVMLAVSCTALIMLSLVAGVVRFYKNMYSAEGYLTFTLPVTNAQHIFVKLFTAIACIAVCSLTVAAAVAIAVPMESLGEFFYDFSLMINTTADDVGVFNTVAYIIEVLIILLLYAAYTLLLLYACITVGQTAKKHRILKAIGAYYVYHIARQVLSTVLSIIIVSIDIPESPTVSTQLPEAVEKIYMIIAIHIALIAVIIFFTAVCAVFWLITQHIMTKKLNLE